MRIRSLYLKNFRSFQEIEIPFNESFNLIIGDNGSGKTTILEALTVAMGSFFLGIKNTDSRNIRETDVRLQAFENSEEFQFPVVIRATGIVDGQDLEWSRELNSLASGTLVKNANTIKNVAADLDARIRSGENAILPILAFYPTGRLWKDLIERDTKKDDRKVVSSRLRAYKSCLQAISTFKLFLKWYKGKELSTIQKREEDVALRVVKNLIIQNLPGCKDLYYEFDQDKVQGLKVELDDGRVMPFTYLSDGTRNLFALLADIAYKCLILNPHLKENALAMTPGVVLIDELDLHLHPEWQKQLIKSLKNTFKEIQFVTTSHSPFVIQETAEGQLLKIENGIIKVSGGDQLSIEDIAEYEQDVDNPQWSNKKKDLFLAAEEYFNALEHGDVSKDLELKVAKLISPFSQNQAFDAFINQIRLAKDKDDEASRKRDNS